METNYDVNYFIKKFKAIPEYKWGTGVFVSEGKRCALGHCGINNDCELNDDYSPKLNLEGLCLYKLILPLAPERYSINPYKTVYNLNDNGYFGKYPQTTPKQRILAALYDIKAMQENEDRTDITKELAVLPVNETSDLKRQLAVSL